MPKTLSDAEIDAFRDRLCDVAEQQFAAHGPDGVTLRQLADALGVSPMTPYRYFKDKDAILAAVRMRAFNRFAEAMEEAQRTMMSGQGASNSGEAYLAFALENAAAYRMMFDVSQPTCEAYPDLVKAMDRARATMGAGLRMAAKAGKFKGDVELAAHAYWSAMHGAVMLELAGMLEGPMNARKVARPAIEALTRMFGLIDPKA